MQPNSSTDFFSLINCFFTETQEELEDSVKALLQQNSDLVGLLEKANIKVPYFAAPKVLSFIITVHGPKVTTNNANADKTPDANASIEQNSNKCDNRTTDKNDTNKSKKSPDTSASNGPKQSGMSTEKAQSSHILPDEGETKKFGSVEVIAVTNSSQFELKPHEQPVKNSVEITPLIAKTPATDVTEPKPDAVETQVSQETNTATTSSATTSSVQSTITSECNSNKSATTPDSLPSKESTVGSSVALETNTQQCTIDLHKSNDIPITTSGVDLISYTSACQTEATSKTSDNKLLPSIQSKSVENDLKEKSVDTKHLPKLLLENLLSSKPPIQPAMKELALPHINTNVTDAENNVHEKDLEDELFESFRLPQIPNESNPNALSPTAAFLLSFPVVSTTSCAKPTETDNSFTSTTNLLRLDEKSSQPKEHSLLESIITTSFDFSFHDLNDVADGKNMSNHVLNDDGQYSYGIGKNRPMDMPEDGNKSKKRSYETIGKHIDHNECNKDEKNNQLLSDTKLAGADFRKPYGSDYLSTAHDYPYTAQYTTLTKPSDAMSALPPTENFYSSLSSLGLPMKPTMPVTTTVPPTTTHFNFQISSLTQSRPNIVESRPPLLADPPQFTFSLTKPTDTAYVSKAQSSIASTSLTSSRNVIKTTKTKPPTKHSVSERLAAPVESTVPTLARCTAYNPFAFDNPSVLSTSSSLTLSNLMTTPSTTMNTMNTTFSFTLTPSFTSMPTTTSMLSNTEPMFSSTFDMPLLGTSSSMVKPATNKKEKTVGHAISSSVKDSINSTKSTRNGTAAASNAKPVKNHVNWMTSPVAKSSQDLDLSTNLFSASTEETSSWSTNRLIDSNSLNSFSTLPQLQGDLSLNTMTSNFASSNSIITGSNNNNNIHNHNSCSYRNDVEPESKKHCSTKTFRPQKFGSSKTNRKPELFQPSKYGKSERSINTFHNYPATVSNTSTVRSNDAVQTVNNFHSVSQLVDTNDRQINKADTYYLTDDKMHAKEPIKQKLPDKLSSMNSCNFGLNDIISNDFDKDVGIGNYLFNPSKRLKLNYTSCSDTYLPANQNVNNYETAATNDVHSSYVNYQNYDTDCSATTAPCINNLANQTFSYQYGQSQPYYQQQQFHAPPPPPLSQNTCDTLEPIITQNYFQTTGPLSGYKSTGLNDFTLTNITKGTTNQPTYATLHASTSKSHYNGADTKTSLSMPNVGQNTNHSIQSLNKSSNRSVASSSKVSTHCMPPPPPPPPSTHGTTAAPANNFNNINNIALNQPWNDSFSWMSYSNHTYNSQLFGNESNISKANNSTANTNTIPNFNLTTIFPDCNKS